MCLGFLDQSSVLTVKLYLAGRDSMSLLGFGHQGGKGEQVLYGHGNDGKATLMAHTYSFYLKTSSGAYN